MFKTEGVKIIAPAGALDYLADDAVESRLQERCESLLPWVNDDTRLVAPGRVIKTQQRF